MAERSDIESTRFRDYGPNGRQAEGKAQVRKLEHEFVDIGNPA